jgi:hypothetical protein
MAASAGSLQGNLFNLATIMICLFFFDWCDMRLFGLPFLAALMLVTPFAMADDCEPKGMTEISVARTENGVLATYGFSAPLSCLKLGERGDVRKLSWQVQTEGAVLSDSGDVVRLTSPRTDFSVRIRALDHDGAMDRVYSPLIAFGDGSAVALYTGYLRPASTERGFSITFNGFAPTTPERKVGPQRIGDEPSYIILGQPVVERRGNISAVVDQAMPPLLLRRVINGISKGEAALRGVTATPRALTYLLTYTDPGEPHAKWRGDALGDLVRLNFMGAPWQQDQADYNDVLDQFILHELVHTASMPALNLSLPGAMTLSEGGAEAVAMSLRRRLDSTAAKGMFVAIDDAIVRCQELAGKTLADKEYQSQRNTPYVCGMALQFMVAAAVQRDPMEVWATMLHKAKPSEAGWPTFLAAAVAAADKGALNNVALAILDDMTASRIDWSGGLTQLANAGLLRRRTEAELAEPAYATPYRTAAILHLLGQFCRKNYGFNSTPSVYVLDAPADTCGTVPDKFRLTAINGINLTRDGYRAHRELARRCAADVPVELSDDQDHQITLACRTPLPDIVLYGLSSQGVR